MQLKTPLRYLLSILVLCTGTLHFVHTATFLRIMPPLLPFPLALVYLTGLCELAAAVGLQVPDSFDRGRIRRLAAALLALFFIAVFPANLYMAFHPIDSLGPNRILGLTPQAATLLRLPLQIPLIAWAWWYTRE